MLQNALPISNAAIINPISPNNTFSMKIRRPVVHVNELHTPLSVIICAKNNSKGFFRSQRSRRTLIQFLNFAASNLTYVLPEPLNYVMREFVGGSNGGGMGGSGRGFRWGGFDGGGGSRRSVKKKLGLGFWFWGLTTVCCLGFWGLVLVGELKLENDMMLGALCSSMFLVLVRHGCVPEWLLGFCSGAVFMVLLVHKRDKMQRFIKGFKAMGTTIRRQRGRRAV